MTAPLVQRVEFSDVAIAAAMIAQHRSLKAGRLLSESWRDAFFAADAVPRAALDALARERDSAVDAFRVALAQAELTAQLETSRANRAEAEAARLREALEELAASWAQAAGNAGAMNNRRENTTLLGCIADLKALTPPGAKENEK